jgi:DnaJ domain/X-domain of DnaJ-containing
VRGVAAAPEAAMAPRQGKWWNENEGKWVLTKMDDEVKSIQNAPDDDSDILGDIEKDLEANAASSASGGGGEVADMFYYEALEVSTTADDSTIRRRYYLLAKKYHPDRNQDNQEAAEKFKDIAEAYQVLSDPELRKRYNRDGRAGLSPDKTSVNEDGIAKIDPAVLFAFLFGSDKFSDYVGRLATATSAQIGNSPKISVKDARVLQKRRVVRLASKLIAKIEPWVTAKMSEGGGDTAAVEAEWTVEANELVNASYGHQLITTIGKVHCECADVT